jgi:hypothetical protein
MLDCQQLISKERDSDEAIGIELRSICCPHDKKKDLKMFPSPGALPGYWCPFLRRIWVHVEALGILRSLLAREEDTQRFVALLRWQSMFKGAVFGSPKCLILFLPIRY